ncbi:MAG: hypothetical protein OEW22_05360, partial [Rubrivivax sp.]|nr:hypothetical protein [Rubrivivax sp.]
HGPFFCALERLLHDHGSLTPETLLDEMARLPDAALLAPLVQRIRALHHFDDEEAPAAQFEVLVLRLRQQAVDDELQLLMESGDLSQDAAQRGKALLSLRAELKRPRPST